MTSKPSQQPQTLHPSKTTKPQPLAISQLNNDNTKSRFIPQPILPKKGHQSDNYQGPVDPQTRLRHGIGTYKYPNKYFNYKGNYNQGVKSGQGTLTLADGTIINGTFQNDQLTGQASITYGDGSTYKGTLLNGQKSGMGTYKSKYQQYQGQYKQNKKQGKGLYKTNIITISGTFYNNKPHGQSININQYNYQFHGEFKFGVKDGKGQQISTYLHNYFQYQGSYRNDQFQGTGIYINYGQSGYKYQGQFIHGQPSLYPNQFRIYLSTSSHPQVPPQQSFSIITSQQTLLSPIQYQLQTQQKLYLKIDTCYQPPQKLDPIQPTQQDIQKCIKTWQIQNKKNKNAVMPNFRTPKMIKPELIAVKQQSNRVIEILLAKNQGTPSQEIVKIDFRNNIKSTKQKIKLIKAEIAKKAQEQGQKKGGKAPSNKNQPQLKVNCMTEPIRQNQKCIKITTQKGQAQLHQLQFPDDFPPATYHLLFQSPFTKFGSLKQTKKPITIKPKLPQKKK